MIRLDDYLEAVMAEPWVWGRMDCCFFGGEWVAQATGRDPLARVRGRYDTALGAARLIAAAGGLVQLVDSVMAPCGFRRADAPEHGDIAVIDMPGHGDQAVARASVVIRSGPWWVGRTVDGIAGVQIAPQAVWRVLCSDPSPSPQPRSSPLRRLRPQIRSSRRF